MENGGVLAKNSRNLLIFICQRSKLQQPLRGLRLNEIVLHGNAWLILVSQHSFSSLQLDIEQLHSADDTKI